MAEWLKVILLGIVEGVTEFLPISSTGHLIVVAALLGGFDIVSLNGLFEIFIQLGAVVAVALFYRADFLDQLKQVRRSPGVRRLWLAGIVALLPAALLGLLLGDWIERTLFSPAVVASALILGGLVFILIERRSPAPPESLTRDLTNITFRQALLIGLAQMLALVPGVSRSGASIVGGMLGGLHRATATVFSFYLAVPTLGTATIFRLLIDLRSLDGSSLAMLLAGALVSGLVAWYATGWLLRFVARRDFTAFGVYRIAAGLLILALLAAGRL